MFAGVVLQADVRVGKHAILNTAATVDHDSHIDDFCHLGPGVNLAGDVRVGRGTTLGTGAAAIPNVRIGEWSMIGAAACVVGDIGDSATAMGVPARVKSIRMSFAVEDDGDNDIPTIPFSQRSIPWRAAA